MAHILSGAINSAYQALDGTDQWTLPQPPHAVQVQHHDTSNHSKQTIQDNNPWSLPTRYMQHGQEPVENTQHNTDNQVHTNAAIQSQTASDQTIRRVPDLSEMEKYFQSMALKPTSIQTLKDQGFTQVEDVLLLTHKDLERLSLPMRDEIKLRTAIAAAKPTHEQFVPCPVDKEPKDLHNLLNNLIGKQTLPTPSRPVDDPLVYLTQPSGEKVTYYDIVDFVPGVVNVKERFTLPGADGRVIFESGPKRPKLEAVSPCQWGAANARIMHKLMLDGILNGDGVQKYLAYTVKICQLGERFMWETVLQYDRQYRELQATLKFEWGVDCPHLHQVALREKPVSKFTPDSIKKSRSNPRQKIVDRNSGKEVCIQYNTHNCPRGESCQYAHLCTICFKNHPKRNHPN